MLNEMQLVNANTVDNADFYHFYRNLVDLVNSLETGKIYSDPNFSATQLDTWAYDAANRGKNYGYVCMTAGKKGKNRALSKGNTLVGPFGIAFKDLAGLAKRHGYIFDADREYSQAYERSKGTMAHNKNGRK